MIWEFRESKASADEGSVPSLPRLLDGQLYMPPPNTHLAPWKNALHEIIFEADTPAGKVFDIALLVAIVLSVLAVCLESVGSSEDVDIASDRTIARPNFVARRLVANRAVKMASELTIKSIMPQYCERVARSYSTITFFNSK